MGNYLTMPFVPDHLKTQEMCYEAVDKDPWNLVYVPDWFKTQVMCNKTVGKDPYNLVYVQEMCDKAVDGGVVLCEQYTGSINGDKMVNIVNSSFLQAFEKSINSKRKRILMDGFPRQNCHKAVKAIEAAGGMIFKIPPTILDKSVRKNIIFLRKKCEFNVVIHLCLLL